MTMGELAKIDSFRREIAVAESIEEIQLLRIKGDAMAEITKKLDIPLKGQNELGRTRIDLEKKFREIIEVKFPTGKQLGEKRLKSRILTLVDSGITKNQSSDAKILKEEEMLAEEVMVEIEKGNEVITPKKVAGEIRRIKIITKQKEKFEVLKDKEIAPLTGKFDVIVIDPPWPMEKIEREVRPNQVGFDYPVMNEAELSAIEIPLEDNCHIWLWTTHKFLPMAFRLLEKWGLKYVCTFVWHKPGGFQPVGLPQYNCEFALYARTGTPKFIDTKNFPVCFNAPRGVHSEKPKEFYDFVIRTTVGRRADMFGRKKIEGFTSWGKEAENG